MTVYAVLYRLYSKRCNYADQIDNIMPGLKWCQMYKFIFESCCYFWFHVMMLTLQCCCCTAGMRPVEWETLGRKRCCCMRTTTYGCLCGTNTLPRCLSEYLAKHLAFCFPLSLSFFPLLTVQVQSTHFSCVPSQRGDKISKGLLIQQTHEHWR